MPVLTVSARKGKSMKKTFSIVGAVVLFVVAGCCAYGFAATFEPNVAPAAFRMLYAVAGIASLGTSAALVYRTRPR